LVMREGTQGRLSKTIFGRLFFAGLQQFALMASLNIRFLIFERVYLSHARLARHRAAIMFLGITNAKRTPHDFYMMDIPMFFPTKALKALALSNTGYYASEPCDKGTHHNVSSWEPLPPFCSWVRVAFQLELSSFYRLPHIFFFNSAADLVRQLAVTDDEDLRQTSRAMRRFTDQRTRDDLAFWRDAVISMACAARDKKDIASSTTAMISRRSNNSLQPPHRRQGDPSCLFGMVSADGTACCPMSCATCQEEGCTELPARHGACCPSVIIAIAAACSENQAPCAIGETGESLDIMTNSSCEVHPAACPQDILRFATHLDETLAL